MLIFGGVSLQKGVGVNEKAPVSCVGEHKCLPFKSGFRKLFFVASELPGKKVIHFTHVHS